MNTRISLLATVTLAALTLAPAAHATQSSLATTVFGTLTTGDGSYGGCMALLAASPSPTCPGNYVAFSCDGTYAPKDMAFHMLDQAQLALALKKTVLVGIDDAKRHNGYCTATRLDVYQ